MKPILFDGSTTNFNTQGIGALSDCISALVTEQRNSIYELEFTYPITGVRYGDITKGRIVVVSHDERKDLQPFTIYHISRPISGVVTVNAHHISYELSNVIVGPYEANNIGTAFDGFHDHAMTDNSFTFWTDKTSAGTFKVSAPASVRALLGGTSGSILDAFGGGEYEFDNRTVKLYQHRGNNNGVTIRYGKNLTDITADTDAGSLYNAVIPYWSNAEDTIVYGGIVQGNGGITREETWTDEGSLPIQDENGETITFRASLRQVVPMDLSGEFSEAPTVAQLEARAQTILNNNEPWIPKVNINIDFIALWQTEEYKNIAPLERVSLCDTVTVQYAELGVDATAKVIRVVWDVLAERYSEMELGDAKTSFADVLMGETQSMMKEYPSTSMMQEAIQHATEQITGGMGGHIVFTLDANGEPIEQLIMDTPDKETAVNVWRWNLGGLGHSHSGYNGPFDDVALTQDGKINASMITVGTLNANVIAANSISVSKLTGSITNGDWKINLDDGTLTIGNISAANITTGTMSAARISGGALTLGGDTGGTLVIKDANGNNIVTGGTSGLSIDVGTLTTTSGNQKTTVGSGKSSYYYQNALIGDSGANSANGENGIVFDLKTAGDYIGWFLNGTSNPILIYDKSDWLSQDILSDCLNVVCDLHISDGATLAASRIANPSWQFSGANYAGYTGSIRVGSRTLVFKNGVLTSA